MIPKKDFSVTGEGITFKKHDQDMLKDGIKLISTPPPQKKKKNISQTSMNCHVQLKIVKFTILRKERKTTDLYIEILIVQANFFIVFRFIIIFSEPMKL